MGDTLVATKYAYGYSKYSFPFGLVPDLSAPLAGRSAVVP